MGNSYPDRTKEIACITSPNLAKKMIIIIVNIFLHICFITFLMCENSKESQFSVC